MFSKLRWHVICTCLFTELLLLSILVPPSKANSEPVLHLEFGTSEPCGLLRFLDSIAEERGEGPALASFFRSQRQLNAEDLKQIQRYKALSSAPGSQLEFSSPAGQKVSLQQKLKATACEFNEFDRFYEKAEQFCAPSYFNEFKKILTHFRPVYEEQIWRTCKPVLHDDLDWFKSNEPKFARPLEQVRHLFQSSLGRKQAMHSTLIPVPMLVTRQGSGFRYRAESADSESVLPRFTMVSVSILDPATAARFNDARVNKEAQTFNECTLSGNCILIHESVHLLWAYRRQCLKKAFYDSFKKSDMIFNYDILNESQAAALSAWFYRNVTGKEDESDWYDNKYVSRFAHALRPLLENYIDSNRSLDQSYAEKAMKLFEETFPDWREDPQIVLWRSQIITGEDEEQLAEKLSARIFKFSSGNHEMRVVNGKTWNDLGKEFLSNPKRNTVFFLKPNQLDLLSNYFQMPENVVEKLKQLRLGSSSSDAELLAGIRTPQRWLIFCISDELKSQKTALENLAKRAKMITSLF